MQMVVVVIEAALVATRSLQKAWVDRSLAEMPKVVGLQMDWLRSEDLKEVKMATAPIGYCSRSVLMFGESTM